jgi:hypothetical protein
VTGNVLEGDIDKAVINEFADAIHGAAKPTVVPVEATQ